MTYYHGGKQRTGIQIAQIIYDEVIDIEDDEDFEIKGYCEPFCGMLGVYQHIPELFSDHKPKLKYKAGDRNKSVVMMWQAAQNGWKPSHKPITKKKFMNLKYDGKSSAEKGFIGHFYGYMGKYFQPFDGRHSQAIIKKTIQKISDISTSKVKNVKFTSGLYTQYSKLKNFVIYCDPPYQKQSHYYTESGEHIEPFDHAEFWNWCRKMSLHNIIFVSEYNAPKDFNKIWSGNSRTTGSTMKEKLYIL